MARLLTVYGLSQELGVSVEWLRRWMAEGSLPAPTGGSFGPVFTERQAREIRKQLVARRLGRYSSGPWFASRAEERPRFR